MAPRATALTRPRKRLAIWLLALSLACVTAIIDAFVERGVAAGIPYLGCILLFYWSDHSVDAWLFAALGTLLVGFGFMISPDGGEIWKVLTNRGLSVIVIWASASLIAVHANHKRALEALARTDTLTGLSNRRALFERMQWAILRSERAQQGFAVIYLDLDRFKQVNDTLGHAAGDAMLRAVARGLATSVREVDLPARVGGDEFMILCEDTDKASIPRLMARLRTGIRAATANLAGGNLIGVSVGVAWYPEDGATADQLAQKADRAMYDHKRARTVADPVYSTVT